MTKSKTKDDGDAAAVGAMRARLQELVPACLEEERALARLEREGEATPYDAPLTELYGKPCADKHVAALEKRLGLRLPPSYRAYLSLYGDKDNDDFPLGAKQHFDEETEEALDDMDGLFDESGKANPIAKGAIPFVLSAELDKMVLLVPPARVDGEMAVVDYDITEEVRRFRDVVAYFEAELAATRALVAKQRGKSRRKPARATSAPAEVTRRAARAPQPPEEEADDEPTMREAIDLVIAGERGKRLVLATRLMSSSSIDDLYEALPRAKTKPFIDSLRRLPEVAVVVAARLASYAAECLPVKTERAKAAPLVELLLDSKPKTPPKRGKHDPWLSGLNDAIHYANRAKERALAEKLATAALPFAAANDNLPHNAACAFVAVGRFDDALAMCRIAVENGYRDLERMKVDRDLGALRKSPEFQALFAGRAKGKSTSHRVKK